jgi:hypothetical protein
MREERHCFRGVALLHVRKHARQLTNRHALLAVEITFADGKTVGDLAHFAPLHKTHFEDVVEQPFRRGEVLFAFGPQPFQRLSQNETQRTRRVVVGMIQRFTDDAQAASAGCA